MMEKGEQTMGVRRQNEALYDLLDAVANVIGAHEDGYDGGADKGELIAEMAQALDWYENLVGEHESGPHWEPAAADCGLLGPN